MRTIIVRSFALLAAVATMSACGNEKSNRVVGQASVGSPAAGLAQQAMVKTEVKAVASTETAAVAATEPTETDTASKGVRHTLVLGEGKGGFSFNAKGLSAEAKAVIDEMFSTRTDLGGAHFVIEGHTDSLGSKAANDRVGLARAEAVRLYLSEKHNISMDCIGVISYGSEKPVGDNETEEGRAQNRRVIIKVVD